MTRYTPCSQLKPRTMTVSPRIHPTIVSRLQRAERESGTTRMADEGDSPSE